MSTERFYDNQPVRFQCSGCGDCCSGDPDTHYVELLAGEAERIRQYLQLSKATFERDYLVSIPDIGKGIRINAQGRCSLLSADKRCLVYEARPWQCRSYPFWPEVMQSHETWMAEANHCEGINQGKEISPQHIDSQLVYFNIETNKQKK
jgi:Fe-S-cluster containining protein